MQNIIVDNPLPSFVATLDRLELPNPSLSIVPFHELTPLIVKWKPSQPFIRFVGVALAHLPMHHC